MTRMPPRMAAVLGVACALLTAACSDGSSLTEPESVPSFSRNEARSAQQTWQSTWSSDSEWSLDSELESDYEWSWELLESDLTWTASSASAVIGRRGGTVTLWSRSPVEGWRPAHTLTVPPGAVTKPTHFVMEVGAGSVIDVHLSATEVRTGRQITEFRQPLSLSLTYAGSSLEDPNKLAIVHVVDGEVVEVVASVVSAEQTTVVGEIWHFSRYAVACE